MRARISMVAALKALIFLGTLGVLASVATAGVTFDYSLQPRTFRACRLLLPGQAGDTASGSVVPRSLIFEGLRRYPYKPAGWDIENPLAPPALSTVGNTTKSVPEYWEVGFTGSNLNQLEGFDLIYIYASGINLSSVAYRDTILRAVHEGAVVWIDQPNGSTTNVTAFAPPGRCLPNTPATTPFTFANSGQTMGAYRRTDDAEMLFRYPFKLDDQQDVQYLGVYPTSGNANWPNAPTVLNQSASPGYVICNDPGLHRVVSVWDPGGNAWLPNMVVYRYGAGAVLCTAGDLGYDLVNWWYRALQNRPYRYQAAESKFGWNVLALASGWPEQGGTVSQRSRSEATVWGPLDIRWQYPDRFEPASVRALGSVVSSPVAYGGQVFALSLGRPAVGAIPLVNPLLLAFDKDPVQDLDHDGVADDGLPGFPDYGAGRSYDMLWATSLNAAGGDWTPRNTSTTIATLSGLLGGGVKLQVALVSVVRRGNPSGHTVGQVRCYNATYDPRILAQIPANDVNGNALPASFRTPGALIWSRTIDSYDGASGGGANGQVIEVTTPVVYRDYVYVLSSELDEDADGAGGATIEDAYGRAHCFQLNYRWDLDANGPQWAFPQATDNPNGDADVAGTNPPADDNATPEAMKVLPPFQPAGWVAAANDGINDFTARPELPPLPAQKPVPDQAVAPRNDYYPDGYLHLFTPGAVSYNSGTGQIDNQPTWGGTEFTLLPMPKPVTATPYADSTNQNNWLIYLPTPAGTTQAEVRVTTIVRGDDNQINCGGGDIYQSGTPPNAYFYAHLESADVRELGLPSRSATSSRRDPLLASQNFVAVVNYEVNIAGTWTPQPAVSQTIYNTVRSRYVFSTGATIQRAAAKAVENGRGYLTTDSMEDDRGNLPNNGTGAIQVHNQNGNGLRWRYYPALALPDSSTSGQSRRLLGKSPLAADRTAETMYAAVTAAISPVAADARSAAPEILGLNTNPNLTVVLRGVTGDNRLRAAPAPVVRTVNGAAAVVVPATAYSVDYEANAITFDLTQAAFVTGCGPLWGKPIWVDYTYAIAPNMTTTGSVTSELHVLKDVLRFQYSPGVIRLNHPVVRNLNITAGLSASDGAGGHVAVTGLVPAETVFPAAAVPGGGNPTWAEGFLVQGLLNPNNLTLPNGEPLRPGSDIVIGYTYWDSSTNSARTVTGERHQVPVPFGESVSAPAVAGATVAVGTEGYHPTRVKDPADGAVVLDNSDLHNPAAATGPILAPNGGRKSLLTVLWDPISRVVRGALSQSAYPEPATYGLASGMDQGTPVTTSAPAVDAGTVLVGSRMMTQLNRVVSYQGQGLGFVSALEPQRTLICDTTRLIEVTGQMPTWTCVGSLAPAYHEAFDPTTEGNQEFVRQPFSRPAKAIYVENGNVLVADTGNNRVIEIDREGRQVWPLDQFGYDFYSRPDSARLGLDRPSDVYRYYVAVDTVSGTRVCLGTHGNLQTNANGTVYTEAHTVVADPGNFRVVEIVTTVSAAGVQAHTVQAVTPDFTRVGTLDGLTRISYTKALPLFRPDTRAVVGYLCVASNLHQLVVVEAGSRRVNPPGIPVATVTPGTYNWNWWAWLYDSNLADTNPAPDNPLVFRNLRDVQLSQEEDVIYVTVTCGQYAGRSAMVQAGTPHVLAAQGAGIFEFAVNIGGTVGTWAQLPAVDTATGAFLPDDPLWRFTGANYTFANNGVRRSLTNILYTDRDGTNQWLPLGWSPVSAQRLPGELRPTGAGERMQRHLVTNYAEMIQNLTRDNVRSLVAPASLFSSVFVVSTDDRVNNDPADDLHDIDRREVIPDPHEMDWPDPFNQPTYAERR